MNEDGTCPKCGVQVDPAVAAGKLNLRALASNGEQEKLPWHFKLLVAALVVYLSWRVVSIFI